MKTKSAYTIIIMFISALMIFYFSQFMLNKPYITFFGGLLVAILTGISFYILNKEFDNATDEVMEDKE